MADEANVVELSERPQIAEVKPEAASAAASGAPQSASPVGRPSTELLGALLMRLGLTDEVEIARARRASGPGFDLAGHLIKRRLVLPQSLAAVGLQAYEWQNFDSDLVLVDPTAIAGIDLARAARKRFLPIAREGDCLHVAVSDTIDAGRIEDIRSVVGSKLKIAPELWPQTELREVFELAFDGRFTLDSVLKEISGDAPADVVAPIAGGRSRRPAARGGFESKGRRGAPSVTAEGPRQLWAHEGVRILNALLVEMLSRGASTLRVEHDQGPTQLRWRIDGVMRRGRLLSELQRRALFETLELMCRERMFRVRLGARTASVEVWKSPDSASATLQVQHLRRPPQSLNALAQTDACARALRRLVAQPRGLILVASPAGQGKTQALADILRVASPARRLAGWIGASPEIDLPDIAQELVGSEAGVLEAIRGLMVQRADVLALDEPLGSAAWAAAIDAAHSGALVLASIRAHDAASAIARVLGFGIAPADLALALRGVYAQALVPALCQDCLKQRHATAAEKRALYIVADHELELAEAEGCESCGGSGRHGRVSIGEVLVSDSALAALISQRAPRAELMAAAKARGGTSLAAEGLARLKNGEIALLDLVQAVEIASELGG